MNSSANIIICRDAKSPYYLAQLTDPLGKRVRRSTKVPTAGGRIGDETLTRAQAKRRAAAAKLPDHALHNPQKSQKSSSTTHPRTATIAPASR